MNEIILSFLNIFRSKIGLKLTVAFLVFSIIPTAFIYIHIRNTVTNQILLNISFSNEKAFTQAGDMLSYRFDKISESVQSIIYSTDIVSLFDVNYGESGENAIIKASNKINVYLDAIRSNPDVLNIILHFPKDNPLLEYYPDQNKEPAILIDWNKYRNDSSEETPWVLVPGFNGDKNISRILYIYNMSDFRVMTAAICIIINPHSFTEILKNAVNTRGTVVYMLNSRNEVIFSSEKTKNWLDDDGLIGLQQIGSSGSYSGTINLEGKQTFTSYRKIKRQKWSSPNLTLVSITPLEEIQRPINGMFKNTLLVTVISAVVSFIFAFLFSSSITRRINSLTYGMRQVQRGKFKDTIIPKGADEITELMSDFNYMTKRIEILMIENSQYISDSRRNELLALQSQINPHFLYNTLDLINWMALKHGIGDISETIQSLSRFYKLSLNQGREIVPLSDEIDHVRAYLDVQNRRFEGAIYSEIDIPRELLGCQITKLTLQPLVENAILHGILPKEFKKGTIKISAEKNNICLIMTIRDDGEGIPEKELESLRKNSFKLGAGYGLFNINERIRLYFGSQYGLRVESREGEYTSVQVILPLRPA
jgi:two-component system sensor histidine kinase YesM